MQTLKAYLLLGSAVVACPCHLPILLVLLAGTGLGGFLSQNLGLVAVGLAGYFILALVLGVRLLGAAGARPASALRARRGNGATACQACDDLSLLGRREPNDAQTGEHALHHARS